MSEPMDCRSPPPNYTHSLILLMISFSPCELTFRGNLKIKQIKTRLCFSFFFFLGHKPQINEIAYFFSTSQAPNAA